MEIRKMKLIYTFDIDEDICMIEGLHDDLDSMVATAGFEVVKSALVSPNEMSEHDNKEER
jgi:hypothetical protein